MLVLSMHESHRNQRGWVAESTVVLILENSGVISEGSGAMEDLPSEAVYEYIETVPMDEKEEPAASQSLVKDEDYDDAEEPKDSPGEDMETRHCLV